MKIFKLANATASVISVTGTATPIKKLIDTAGSSANLFPVGLDAVDINVESGDIRVLYDGNTPTASLGLLVKRGTTLFLRRAILDNVILIAVSGTVSCSVQVGQADLEEISALSIDGAGSSASSSRTSRGNQQTQIVNSTTETTIVTAIAGTFADLTALIVTNASTTTPVTVTIKDATAGTTRMVLDLAANGGAVIPLPAPLNQATANNNWTATLSNNTTTVNITAAYVKST